MDIIPLVTEGNYSAGEFMILTKPYDFILGCKVVN
jgi:hypothetical protein